MPEPALYPLRFKEILRNYPFGGRWITQVYQKTGLPEDHRVAETWEAVDRPNESSEIINGALAGQTLHQAIERYGERLLGADIVARCGARFPLLIKFLDASNPLGEQIHLNDEQARAAGSSDPGKTEAWYMLHVRPGGSVYVGNKPGVTRESLAQALMDDTSRLCMVERIVSPGDAFLLYAGTMHYSPGGVLFYEIMQNSDVTIGLGPRFKQGLTLEQQRAKALELAHTIHLEEPFDCQTKPVTLTHGVNRQTFIFACRYFSLERLDLAETATLSPEGQRFYVLSVIEGNCNVRAGAASEKLLTGQSCLIPACLDEVKLEPQGNTALLKAYVPDLVRDVIAPLRAAGVGDAAIRGLGGVTRLSDLAQLL